jgi:hypothetical protein
MPMESTLTVYTDHAALKSMLSTKSPKGRIARWMMLLQSYEFTVTHRKGAANKDTDALSMVHHSNEQTEVKELTLHGLKDAQASDAFTQKIMKSGVQPPFKL